MKEIMNTLPWDSPRNWTEDYVSENGQYLHVCMECEEQFFGQKRRPPMCHCCADGASDGDAP